MLLTQVAAIMSDVPSDNPLNNALKATVLGFISPAGPKELNFYGGSARWEAPASLTFLIGMSAGLILLFGCFFWSIALVVHLFVRKRRKNKRAQAAAAAEREEAARQQYRQQAGELIPTEPQDQPAQGRAKWVGQ